VMRPTIGIIGNHFMINEIYPAQAVGEMYVHAVAEIAQATPIIIPSVADVHDVGDLLRVCQGILLTGGRPNVHPSLYGHEETEAHGPFDHSRDDLALALSRACVDEGVPLFGTCRGFQEMNVAFGGTLHPEIRELPGRDNHRMPPDGTLEERFAIRQNIRLTPGGVFADLFGAEQIRVNTLHGQGILETAERIEIDGWAEDGTPEALFVRDAKSFALGVQWHPEANAANDPISRALFGAFGAAARQSVG